MARQLIVVYPSDAPDGVWKPCGLEAAIVGLLPAHLQLLCRCVLGPDGPEMTCIDDGGDESGSYGVFKLPEDFAPALRSGALQPDGRLDLPGLALHWCGCGTWLKADAALRFLERLLLVTAQLKPDGVWFAMYCAAYPDDRVPEHTILAAPIGAVERGRSSSPASTPSRVDHDELDLTDGLYQLCGRPFSGVSVVGLSGGYAEREFLNGERSGRTCVWHPNGRMVGESHYLSGKRHGTSHEWDEAGTLIKVEEYDRGNCLSRHRWEAARLVEAWRAEDVAWPDVEIARWEECSPPYHASDEDRVQMEAARSLLDALRTQGIPARAVLLGSRVREEWDRHGPIE